MQSLVLYLQYFGQTTLTATRFVLKKIDFFYCISVQVGRLAFVSYILLVLKVILFNVYKHTNSGHKHARKTEREKEKTITSEYLLFTPEKSRLTIPTNGNLLKTTKKHPEGRSTTTLKRPTKRRFAANQSQVSPFQMTPTNRRHNISCSRNFPSPREHSVPPVWDQRNS